VYCVYITNWGIALLGLLDYKFKPSDNFLDPLSVFKNNLRVAGVTQEVAEKLGEKLTEQFEQHQTKTILRLEYLVKISGLALIAKRQNDAAALAALLDLVDNNVDD